MHQLLVILADDSTPPAVPGLRPGLTQDMVTPGLLGFIMTAFMVILTVFLIVDMVRRIRRVRYRGELAEAQAALEAEGESTAEGEQTGVVSPVVETAPEKGDAAR